MTLLSRIQNRLFYGWVVLATCFVLCLVIYGVRNSFGVFFTSIESDFELSRTATSGVFSIYMVLYSFVAILGGWALDRYGPRVITFLMGLFIGLSLVLTGQARLPWQLFITYSLLFAIGTGAAYAVLMSTVSRWFDRKRGLALGIAGSGIGVGIVVMAPLSAYLITKFDWRMAFVLLGLLAWLIVCSLSLLMRKDPSDIGALPDGMKTDSVDKMVHDNIDGGSPPLSFSIGQALRTRSFWCLGISWVLWSACMHLVFTHVVPYATDSGISTAEAARILGLIGLISIPARLIVGTVSDRIGRKVSAVICALLQAVAVVWLMWAYEPWAFYVFATVYGLGYGGFDPPTVALVGDTFGVRSIGMLMGVLGFGWAIGAAIGPALGGFIYDVNGSYLLAFLIGAIFMLVSAVLVSLTRREANRSI